MKHSNASGIDIMRDIGIKNGYILIEESVIKETKKERVKWKCVKCDRIDTVITDSIERGRKCICSRRRNEKYTFKEALQKFESRGFTFLDDAKKYKNSHTQLLVKCNQCGYQYHKSISRLDKGCINCKGVRKYTQEEVEKETRSRGVTLLNKYKTARKDIYLKCDMCGYEWRVMYSSWLNRYGNGCHNCEKNRRLENKKKTYYCIGKEEQEIVSPIVKKVFKGYKIIPQKLVDIQGKKSFPYSIDFYIPKLKLAIEYDERYHKFHTERDLKRENEIKNVLKCTFIRIKQENIENVEEYLIEEYNKIKELL